MRNYQILLMACTILFLLMSAVSASEVENITNDGIHLNQSSNQFVSASDVEDILGSDDNSQLLKANRTFNGNTFSQLQDEIDNCRDNDVILFEKDIFQDGNASISITKSVTIDGNGHAIDAQHKSGIFNIGPSNVILKNIAFKNANGKNGGAIFSQANTVIDNCMFTNNTANSGGAIYLANGLINISLSIFLNNSANDGGAIYCINSNSIMNNSFFTGNNAVNAGAISYVNSKVLIENSHFDNNVADGNAGAILLNNSNSVISDSYFEFNAAGQNGAAIYSAVSDRQVECNISASTFLNNKAKSKSLTVDENYAIVIIQLIGGNNYINAIYSQSEINFKNVQYWNGNITNTDDEVFFDTAGGQNITLEIYDSQNTLLINTTLITNNYGQQYLNLFNFDDGHYTYKAYHLDDSYYSGVDCNGDFTLSRYSSSITLNISNYAEFYYNSCSIPFDVKNRTAVRFVITNEDGSVIYINDTVDQYSLHIFPDLASSGEYYKITVYNGPSGVYKGSQDSKFFKILSINSKISIHPIADTIYGKTVNVSCDVENKTSIRLIVYDEVRTIVYEVIAENDEIALPVLPAGQYGIIVENIGTENITGSVDSTTLNVLKANNTVSISANNVVYGNTTRIIISADADGIYTVDFNGDLINIEIRNGEEIWDLRLPAGDYYVNATFNNPNYNTFITNVTFNVSKADNDVHVLANNVIYGKSTLIRVYAQVDGVYLLNVSGIFVDVEVFNGQGKTMMQLPVGNYYIDVFFYDENYETRVTNATFTVSKANNNVKVLASDVVYGNATIVEINAQVDGNYTLDVNGKLVNVSVVNGRGEMEFTLPSGFYHANVTFEHPNYNSIITNATFNVLKASNLVYVLADDAVYGNSTHIGIFAEIDGNYTLDVNGKLMNVSVVDGEGIIEFNPPNKGIYYANVTFSNPNYDSEIINTTFHVLDSSDFKVGYYEDLDTGDVIFNMTVLKEATGNVTVNFANKTYLASIYNGSASVRVFHPKSGDYNVVIKYSGDDKYIRKTENIDVHVKNIVIDAYDVEYGWAKSIIYSVKLIYDDGSACYNKNVSFYINGNTFKSTTDGNGIAQVVLGLNIGSYDIVVESEYGNVTKKIKVVSRFSGNKNINMYYYDGTKYSFNVYGDNGKLVGAGESVVIKLNKKTYTLKTDKNGAVRFTIPNTVKIGTYTIEASYKGQTIKNSVNVKQILSSKKTVKVKKSAKKLVLKAKLKKKLKGKKIIFKFKGKKYVAKTNKNGIAKVKINKKVIKKLKKGKKYTVKISYFSTLIKTKVKVR